MGRLGRNYAVPLRFEWPPQTGRPLLYIHGRTHRRPALSRSKEDLSDGSSALRTVRASHGNKA